MGLIVGLIKRILKLFLYFAIFIVIIILIPNLLPNSKFTKIKIEPPQPRTGVLSPNEALNNAHKLYSNKLHGPETFRIFNGELYTGLATGEIIKISPSGHITFVSKIGQPCTGLSQEHICGRPLGFEIDEKNQLMYVADAYYGIWKVNLKTDKKQLLVSPNVAINGRIPKIFNSVALHQSGDLFWTHSTSDFDLKDGAIACLTDPSGRLLHYSAAKNQSEVLLDDLWFANGVVISPDNQFVLISETNHNRVIKYYIDGPNKGKSETFVTGLPGVPDNLHVLPDGSGVLVGLYLVFDNENPLLTQSMASVPLARKFFAQIQRLIEIPFEFLNQQYPNIIFEEIIYKIGHFTSVSNLVPNMSGLVQLDWNGNIVASYYNNDSSMRHLSDAIVYNDKLYMGSPHSQYIGIVPAPSLLKKAFTVKKIESSSIQNKQDKVESIKVTSSINKPEVQKPKVSKTTTEKTPNIESEVKTDKVQPSKKNEIKIESSAKKTEFKDKENKLNNKEKKEKVDSIKPTDKPIVQEKQKENVKKPVEKKIVDVKQKIGSKETGEKLKFEEEKHVNAKKPIEKPKVNLDRNIDSNKPTEKPKVSSPEPPKKINNKPTVEPKESQSQSAKMTENLEMNKKSKEGAKQEDMVGATRQVNSEAKSETAKSLHKNNDIPKQTKKSRDGVKTNAKSETHKSLPGEIPVKEDIPSDRVKPNIEKLKVIKKSGPVEIPNPK